MKMTAPIALLALGLMNPAVAQSLSAQPPAPLPVASLTVAASFDLAGGSIDGERITELSGLAWDADEQRLYAVSDRGLLFAFSMSIGGGQLDLVPLSAVRLAPPPGGSGPIDAEGLAVAGSTDGRRGNSELLVATEGRPQVVRYTPAGKPIGTLALPGDLARPERFRRANAMLEAVGIDPIHGLLAAAEAPLEGEPAGFHRVVAHARAWRFPAHAERGSRLKAMDMMEDGRLLVLERATTGKSRNKSTVAALRVVDLPRCVADQVCAVSELALLDGADEGASERANQGTNYEGLAYLGGGRALVVSDDRGKSSRATRFTLLVPVTASRP